MGRLETAGWICTIAVAILFIIQFFGPLLQPASYDVAFNIGLLALQIGLLTWMYQNKDERIHPPLIGWKWRKVVDAGFVILIIGAVIDLLGYPYPSVLADVGISLMSGGFVLFFIGRWRLLHKRAEYG